MAIYFGLAPVCCMCMHAHMCGYMMQAYLHIIIYTCAFVNTVHISAGDKWGMVAAHIECLHLFNPLTLAVGIYKY